MKFASQSLAKAVSNITAVCTMTGALFLAFSNQAKGQEDSARLIEFLSPHGCAIGPSTRTAAILAGFSANEVDALTETARSDFDTVVTEDWLVLSPQLCTIRPPEVRSTLRLTDPEVVASLSAIDEFEDDDYGARGCFLDPDTLTEAAMQTRGWSEARAWLEYMRLLSENLASGDMVFYSSDPLATPISTQVITGDCADVPAIDEMRRSHALMIEHYDALVRTDMLEATCTTSGTPSWKFAGIFDEITGGENTNAWQYITMNFIAIGGGWYEGATGMERGEPRPPLCLYEENVRGED